MPKVLIVGGHGKVALLACPLLVERGYEVTSLVRHQEQATDVAALGARAVVLDVEQASVAELASVFRGQDAIVWSAGAGGGDPLRTYAVDRDAAKRSIDAAAPAGVRRYLSVSYLGAGPQHGVNPEDPFYAYAQSKAEADAYLRQSDLDWTVLGPGRLTMGEATGIRRVTAGTPEPGTTDTSRANVARVIVSAIGDERTFGKTIEFTDGTSDIRSALGD